MKIAVLGEDFYLLHFSFQWLYLCGFHVGKVEYGNYENYRYTLAIKFKEQILLTILENKMFYIDISIKISSIKMF